MKRICVLFLIGCGGGSGGDDVDDGSGVDPTLPIGTLGVAEVDDVCTYGAGLSRPVMCNDREVESVTTKEACLDLFDSISGTCPATVDDIETCFEALAAQSDADVCGLATPASCGFLGDPSCIDI